MLEQEDQRAPFIVALAERHGVAPIDLVDAQALSNRDLLIVAQPRGLDGLEKVTLDGWVRKGGHVLIFADPELVWPSSYPLGDPRRAPPVDLLAQLTGHWGLRLVPDQGRADVAHVNGSAVAVDRSGYWESTGPACKVLPGGLVADCAFGSGRAVLVGDADLLDGRLWDEAGIDNRDALMTLVAQAAR